MKVWINAQDEKYISYELFFSTFDIENILFNEEYSPEPYPFEVVELTGEYRLIGDELMRLDKKNLPPDSVPIEEKSFFKSI